MEFRSGLAKSYTGVTYHCLCLFIVDGVLLKGSFMQDFVDFVMLFGGEEVCHRSDDRVFNCELSRACNRDDYYCVFEVGNGLYQAVLKYFVRVGHVISGLMVNVITSYRSRQRGRANGRVLFCYCSFRGRVLWDRFATKFVVLVTSHECLCSVSPK